MTDLMSALMVTFLLMSIGYAYQVSEQARGLEKKSENITRITSSFAERRKLIYDQLMSSFSSRLEVWQASIDEETLTFRFENPNLLFETGSAKLKVGFLEILEEFWPKYTEILQRHSSIIREVKIEGHTSSDWENATLKESYFNNMRLSQERTRSTLESCYEMTPEKSRLWVRSLVTSNGMSFSRVIRDGEGNEDAELSRRVEFTVVIDAGKSLEKIIGELDD